jgi:hypothetical protein
MIDQKLLKEFVGEVKDLLKIDAVKLFSNKYRINVWTCSLLDDIIPEYKIHSTYFVAFEDGVIVDKTIKKEYHVSH